MSKLADRIRKASHASPAPMGFAAATAKAPVATLLTIVRLSTNEAGKVAEAAEKGAAALLIDGADPGKLKEIAQKAPGIPVGVRLQKGGRKDVSALREAGADFVVLDTGAMAEAMLEKRIGFVLVPTADADDTTLRLLSDFSLDALIAPRPDGELTLGRLLELRRLASLARTALLAQTAADASASHLQALREAGVIGVIVDSSAIGRLAGLRETIASLPPRGRRPDDHADAVLPAQAMTDAGEEDEED